MKKTKSLLLVIGLVMTVIVFTVFYIKEENHIEMLNDVYDTLIMNSNMIKYEENLKKYDDLESLEGYKVLFTTKDDILQDIEALTEISLGQMSAMSRENNNIYEEQYVVNYYRIKSDYENLNSTFQKKVNEDYERETKMMDDLESYVGENIIDTFKDYSSSKCAYDMLYNSVDYANNKELFDDKSETTLDKYKYLIAVQHKYSLANNIDMIENENYKKDLNMYNIDGEDYLIGFIFKRPHVCIINSNQDVTTLPYREPTNFNYDNYTSDILDFYENDNGNYELYISMNNGTQSSEWEHSLGWFEIAKNDKLIDHKMAVGRMAGSGAGSSNYLIQVNDKFYVINLLKSTPRSNEPVFDFGYKLSNINSDLKVEDSVEIKLESMPPEIKYNYFYSYVVVDDNFEIYIAYTENSQQKYKHYVIDYNLDLTLEEDIDYSMYQSQKSNDILKTNMLYTGIEPIK